MLTVILCEDLSSYNRENSKILYQKDKHDKEYDYEFIKDIKGLMSFRVFKK